MDKIIEATYDGEVFRPDEPVKLESNIKVKVIVPGEKETQVKSSNKNC